ncbi:g152 [Coccomyxa elongata]
MASDRWLADAPAAVGAFQRPCLGRFRQGGSSAPSKFQSREARLQGCYRRPALPCHSRLAGAAATGAPHPALPPARSLCYRGSRQCLLQEAYAALPLAPAGAPHPALPPARSLCYRGSRQCLLQEAYAALPLAPAGASAIGARARSSAGALTVLQGKPPAPAKGGLRCLATRPRRVRPLQEHRTESCRRRAACATGAAAGACYRRPTLHCLSGRPEACAALPLETGGCGRYRSTAPAPPPARSLCYRGSSRRLL